MTKDILLVLNKILSLGEAYISTREAAFERHLKKRDIKAIDIAQEGYDIMEEIFSHIFISGYQSDNEFIKLKKKLYKNKKKFRDYD